MGSKDEGHAMSAKLNSGIAVVGIDIGKNSFYVATRRRRATRNRSRYYSMTSPSCAAFATGSVRLSASSLASIAAT